MIKATHALLMVSGVLGNNSDNGSGDMTNDAKNALLAILGKVAYVNENGQTYYDALETALFPPPGLVSISAVFTQGSAVIYDTDTLDTLRQYLVVTALYEDSTTETVTSYELSGTLTVGTSTITATYGGKSATFNVTVTKAQNGFVDGTYANGSVTLSMSQNALLWGDYTTKNVKVDVPLKYPISLHSGDVVKLTSINSGTLTETRYSQNCWLNNGSIAIILFAYDRASYSASKTLTEDMELSSIGFTANNVNVANLGFTLSLSINNEEVF